VTHLALTLCGLLVLTAVIGRSLSSGMFHHLTDRKVGSESRYVNSYQTTLRHVPYYRNLLYSLNTTSIRGSSTAINYERVCCYAGFMQLFYVSMSTIRPSSGTEVQGIQNRNVSSSFVLTCNVVPYFETICCMSYRA
jgi:hypothetical protein